MMIDYICTLQYCKENKTLDKTKCPVPDGGCRYAFWNEAGQWCHLAGNNCDMQSAASQKTVIDTMHGKFIEGTCNGPLLVDL